MSGLAEVRPPRKSAADRAVEFASELIVSIAEDEAEKASTGLRRIQRQKISARVLIVLAVIAAGALKAFHGDEWKQHITDYPENLDREEP